MAKGTQKEKREIKKLTANAFEVSEVSTRQVDKKTLSAQIKELEDLLEQKKRLAGIDRLEEDIQKKKDLLEEINATK